MSDLDNEEIEATKKLQEKNADEMMKELGYKKYESIRFIEYHNGNNIIVFDIYVKHFYCSKFEEIDFITMQELKAINKKCEELGWLNVNGMGFRRKRME